MRPLPRWITALALVILVTACGRKPDGLATQVQAEVSPTMPTAVHVQWKASADIDGAYVEFGHGTLDYRATATVDPDGTARATLLGLKPSRAVQYRIVEVTGDAHRTGEQAEITTGARPTALPTIQLERAPHSGRQPGFLVTSLLAGPPAAVILDGDGDYVWWHIPDGTDVYVSRAYYSRVSAYVLYLVTSTAGGIGDASGERRLVKVSADGSDVQTLDVQGVHHDFFELGDGTVALLEYDVREVDGVEVQGDRIVELSPGGSRRTVWSVWDHATYDPGSQHLAGQGWTHANALDYDRGTDTYQVSLCNFDAIWTIDRTTGVVVERIGGADSDYRLADGSTALFSRQHQFERLDGGLLVFDNGDPDRGRSRVLEYTLDRQAGLAVPAWEYELDEPAFCMSLGDVTRLRSGHTVSTWSTQGQVDVLAPDGSLAWRLRADLGGALGYARWRDSLYDTVDVWTSGKLPLEGQPPR